MLNKRKALFLLIFSLILGSCGCWDYRELNSLAIVAGAGLDLAEEPGRVKLTVQVIKPDAIKSGDGGTGGSKSGGGGGQQGQLVQPVQIVTSTGETVFRAVRNIIPQSSRRLLFSHMELLVVGEDAAKQGIYPLLDLFTRDPEPRPDLQLIIGKNAIELLKVHSGTERIPAYGHIRVLRTAAANGYVPEVTLQDFVNRLMSRTAAAIAPWAETYQEVGMDGLTDNRLIIEGTAVFKGDKLAGRLDRDETRGLLWVLGKVKTGAVVVDGPAPNAKVGLEIIGMDKKITPLINDGLPAVRVEVNVESNLGDQMYLLEEDKPDLLEELKKLEAEAIRREILRALNKARQLNADIFDFGGAFARKYPDEWKEFEANWGEIFPDFDVEIMVNAEIRHIGVTSKPQSRQK